MTSFSVAFKSKVRADGGRPIERHRPRGGNMKGLNLLAGVCLSVLLSVSAHAACGGGGFNAARQQPTQGTAVSSSSAQPSSAGITGRNSNSFDVSQFHAISGKLHL